MRKWLEILRHRYQMRQGVALGVQIADRSRQQVWNRVRTLIFKMDAAEVSGYVRARAVAVVREQMFLVLGKRHNLSARTTALVGRLATERVVHLVLVDFLSAGEQARRTAA